MRFIRNNVEREAVGSEAERLLRLGFVPIGDEDAASARETAANETAEPMPQSAASDTEDCSTDLESLTVSELRKLAKEKGIGGASGLSKKDLIAILGG